MMLLAAGLIIGHLVIRRGARDTEDKASTKAKDIGYAISFIAMVTICMVLISLIFFGLDLIISIF